MKEAESERRGRSERREAPYWRAEAQAAACRLAREAGVPTGGYLPIAVPAGVTTEIPVTHLDYSIREPVEKVGVVVDKDDGTGEALELGF